MNFKEYILEKKDLKLAKLEKALEDAEHNYKVSKEFYDAAVAWKEDKEEIKRLDDNMYSDEMVMKKAEDDLRFYEDDLRKKATKGK